MNTHKFHEALAGAIDSGANLKLYFSPGLHEQDPKRTLGLGNGLHEISTFANSFTIDTKGVFNASAPVANSDAVQSGSITHTIVNMTPAQTNNIRAAIASLKDNKLEFVKQPPAKPLQAIQYHDCVVIKPVF